MGLIGKFQRTKLYVPRKYVAEIRKVLSKNKSEKKTSFPCSNTTGTPTITPVTASPLHPYPFSHIHVPLHISHSSPLAALIRIQHNRIPSTSNRRLSTNFHVISYFTWVLFFFFFGITWWEAHQNIYESHWLKYNTMLRLIKQLSLDLTL